MNLIAAVDRNWAIGYKNSLLVHIPRDQKTFREMTEGKVIVIGRKTLESFPQKQPLANRCNYFIKRKELYCQRCDGGAFYKRTDESIGAV